MNDSFTVYGAAYPGELLAILGSSGAGKTTLLNALTFRSTKGVQITGLRCINGYPVSHEVLVSQSAYVQQDDLFIGCLTVKEHLRFQVLRRKAQFFVYLTFKNIYFYFRRWSEWTDIFLISKECKELIKSFLR